MTSAEELLAQIRERHHRALNATQAGTDDDDDILRQIDMAFDHNEATPQAFTSTAEHLFASFAHEHAWRSIEYMDPPFEPTLDDIASVPAAITFEDGRVCALTPPQIAIICTIAYAPRRRVRLVSRRRMSLVTIHSRVDDHRRIRLLLAPTGTGKTIMALMSAMLALTRTYEAYEHAWRASSALALLPIVIVAAPRATMSCWMSTTRACIRSATAVRFDMLPLRVDDIKVTRTYIKRAQASRGLFVIVQSSEVSIVVSRLLSAGYCPFGLIHDEMSSERVQLTHTNYPFVLGITATPSSIPTALMCVRYDTLWRREIGSYVHSNLPSATYLADRSLVDIATVASMDVGAHYYPWLISAAIERMPTGLHIFDVGIVDRSLTHMGGAREIDPTNQISLANLCNWLQMSGISEADAPLPIVTLLAEFDAPDTSERAHECMRRLRKRIDDGDIACVVCYQSMVQANELTCILITPCCTNLVCAPCYARLQVCPYCRRALGTAETQIVNDTARAPVASAVDPQTLPADRDACATMLRALPPFSNAFVACERILDMFYSVGLRRVILAWRFDATSLTLQTPTRRFVMLSPDTSCRHGRRMVADTIAEFNQLPAEGDPVMYVLVINSAVIKKHTEVAGINLPITDAIIFTGVAHDQVIGRILRMGEVGQASKLVVKFTTH
jgi:hypothetical protein